MTKRSRSLNSMLKRFVIAPNTSTTTKKTERGKLGHDRLLFSINLNRKTFIQMKLHIHTDQAYIRRIVHMLPLPIYCASLYDHHKTFTFALLPLLFVFFCFIFLLHYLFPSSTYHFPTPKPHCCEYFSKNFLFSVNPVCCAPLRAHYPSVYLNLTQKQTKKPLAKQPHPPFKTTNPAAPICLPEKNEDFLGKFGWAAGWGALNPGSRLRPKTLQAVDVPVLDNR